MVKDTGFTETISSTTHTVVDQVLENGATETHPVT